MAATSQWHIWLFQGLLSSPLKIFHLVSILLKERNSSPLLNLLCLVQSSRQMWVNLKIWCPFTSCKPKWFWVKLRWCPQSKWDVLTGVWQWFSRAIIKGVSTILPQAEGNISASKVACTARDAYSASEGDSQNTEAVTQLTLCKLFPKTYSCPYWN